MSTPPQSKELSRDQASADFGYRQQVGSPSISRGWKRWKRHIKCMIAAYLPDFVISRARYQPQQTARANWDAEFSNGHWDYLRGSSEIARYGIIASFCHNYSSGDAILDMGCGEGILRRHINLDHFEHYLGVDLSLDAINKATHRYGGARSRFMVGDAEGFEIEEHFDVVVFNEMLYYLDDPCAVLRKYQPYLSPSGVFVVSMFDMLKSRKIWHSLDRQFQLLESSRAVNQGGHSWTIRVYRPKG